MDATRVLLVDDHQLFREGLSKILNSQTDFQVVGEANDGLEALVKARKLKPGLILMDVSMPGCDGLVATRLIQQEMPEVVIVMLTVRDEDEDLFQAIRNGARGYILKTISAREMLEMLRGALQGEAAITPVLGGRMLEEFRRISQNDPSYPDRRESLLTTRERQILGLVAAGGTNKEIAAHLQISIHTVKTHMRKILAKLHLQKRSEAASYAFRKGLIPPVKPD